MQNLSSEMGKYGAGSAAMSEAELAAAAKIERSAAGGHEAIDRMIDPDAAAASVHRASAGAHEMVDRMAEKASQAAHRLSEQGHRLAETGDHWAQMTRDCVRRHPFASVGMAVGAGLLLSMVTRKRATRTRRYQETDL